jgi:23S rRNA pseudouridine1911/1915/1917 synthase
VHRIDKDTSGLLVVAKTELAREHLKSQLAAHSVTRSYECITIGVPPEGRISSRHGRDPRNRLRFSSRVSEGKEAITYVQVLEPLGGGRAALVRCRLETGRTHQIRVHLSQQSRTPLLGDELYGGTSAEAGLVEVGRQLGRQALHAKVLGFRHPTTDEQLHFEVPLPEDMRQALDSLRNSA